MKEIATQSQIPSDQLNVSLVIASHLANRNLNHLDPSPLSLVINIARTDFKLDPPNEDVAAKTVIGWLSSTLTILWDRKSSQNAKEQQLIDGIRLLKSLGMKKEEIVGILSLHFS